LSELAMKKMTGHLWYLSEELISLALFDDNVPNDTKRLMVRGLQTPSAHAHPPPKRITLETDTIETKNLKDFVTQNTHRFFSITGLPSTFLDKDVDLWSEDEDYQAAKKTVSAMRVSNDIAERGVALMEEYNKLLTTSEEQNNFCCWLSSSIGSDTKATRKRH